MEVGTFSKEMVPLQTTKAAITYDVDANEADSNGKLFSKPSGQCKFSSLPDYILEILEK